MKKIKLNFVPLSFQYQDFIIYRKMVSDSSVEKEEGDYRVKLPEKDGEKKWILFDVSLNEKNGYDEFSCNLQLNPVLSVHIIYKWLVDHSNNNCSQQYYLPKKGIIRKEICFTIRKFKEGNSEIIVQPFFLKESGLFGFLLEHKFRLKEEQPFNRETQILSYSLDRSGKPNVYFYKDKKREIEQFINSSFLPLLSGSIIAIKNNFADISTDNLALKSYVVGNERAAKSQFLGIKSNGPYRQIKENVRYLFIFTERTRSLARDVYLGLIGRLFPGQFSGLNRMFFLNIHKDIVNHQLVETFDANSFQTIENRVEKIKKDHPRDKTLIILVLPKGFKGVKAAFDAYGHMKLLALRKEAYCQVITEDTFFKKDQLKWSISNIGLQIFSKLGGAPWLVKPAKNKCLIFGIGSVQEKIKEKISKYTAYTVCLDSSGDFKYIKPLSSSSSEDSYLDSLKMKLREVLTSELGEQYKSLVLHLPYKISINEVQVIKDVVASIRRDDQFEVIIVRINTKHKFLGFSDHNTCVPYESTYVQLSKNEFLIWAEGLQYGKEVLHKRVSEPLYVNFLESKEDWTTKKECLQDILNLTGANWRGFNSKAQPISILYSRLIAKFMKEFSHLETVNDMSIVSAESVAPWFL